MMSQLVAVLLDHGVLGPPSDVTRRAAIKAGSATQFLRTETPRMAALYGPPWSMTGTVKPGRRRPPGVRACSFAFRPVDNRGVPIAGRTDTLELAGTVYYRRAPRHAARYVRPRGLEAHEGRRQLPASPRWRRRTRGDGRAVTRRR